MALVTLGPVRLTRVNLFEPKAYREGDEKKYSVTVLIDKNDKNNYSKLQKAIKEAEREAAKGVFQGKVPPNIPNPVHDGDLPRRNGEEYGPECKGHWVMTASSKETLPPELIAGRDAHPATPRDLYSGCYGYVDLNIVGYNYNNMNKGIGAYINSVWKTKDGEHIGFQRRSAKEAFENMAAEMEFDEEAEDLLEGFNLLNEDDDVPF